MWLAVVILSCLWVGLSANECKPGWYGQSCSFKCPANCNRTCDINNGSCTNGCKGYFSGDRCNECRPGRYGISCYDMCPGNCRPGICDKNSGNCMHGCKIKFTGDKCCIQNGLCEVCSSSEACHKCMDGFYGQTCSKPCSDGCLDKTCHRDIGNCSHSCKHGYFGDKCCLKNGYCSICQTNSECTECRLDFFGKQCNLRCPNNCKNHICNRSNGQCTLGCVSGYTGDKCCSTGYCKECSSNRECLTCEDGYYGALCNKQCSAGCSSRKCNKKTGVCMNGCKNRYSGDLCCIKNGYCDKCSSATICKQCISGYYGSKCNTSCSNGCKNDMCDQYSGKCTQQCKTSFTGDRCCLRDGFCQTCKTNDECLYCKNGFFGHNCDKNCSYGCKYDICTKQNGTCTYQCKYRYSGDKCCLLDGQCSICKSNTECSECRQYFYGEKCNQRCPSKCKHNFCNKKNGTCRFGCQLGYTGDKCCSTGQCKQCLSESKCLSCEDGYNGESCETPCSATVTDAKRALASAVEHTAPSVEIVVAIIAVAVIGLVVAGLVIFMFNKRKRGNNAAPAQEEREDISLERVNVNQNQPVAAKAGDNAAYENVGDVSATFIPKESIVEYVANTAKEKFIEKFMLLPSGLTKPYNESQKPRNMIRNRYAAIYPYDHSRVILKGTDNDYINANYIHGYNKSREYIACLGPTFKSMVEFKIFWHMVWQEEVEIIVMLTNLRMPSRMEGEQYWPEPGTSSVYGDVTVTCRDENIFADYVVRNLNLMKNGQTRVLYHVHYTAWPDKSIPNDVISIINFQQRVASLRSGLDGPVVVHCSTGVGMTGTFIALDYLCQQADAEVAVDIYECVRTLRDQRTMMVQTAEQYIYLHQAVAVFATLDCHTIRSECFVDYVTTLDNNIPHQMFTKLNTCMAMVGIEETEAVRRNRSHTDINHRCADIPGDLFRPKLTLNRFRWSSDYVNAVYLNSLTTKNKYIIAQTPLQNGIEDFLTLVIQEQCSVIVDLDPVMPKSKQPPHYLVENNKSKEVGCVEIMSRNVENSSHFIQRDLDIEMRGQEYADVLSVKHFRYSDWSSCHVVPESPEEFIEFVLEVEREAAKAANKGPVLIHCRNAAERSCLFYVVALSLQKIQTEHEVSVITSVLQARNRRRQAIPNMEQFLFCHHCVEAYLQTFETHVYAVVI